MRVFGIFMVVFRRIKNFISSPPSPFYQFSNPEWRTHETKSKWLRRNQCSIPSFEINHVNNMKKVRLQHNHHDNNDIIIIIIINNHDNNNIQMHNIVLHDFVWIYRKFKLNNSVDSKCVLLLFAHLIIIIIIRLCTYVCMYTCTDVLWRW